MADGILDWLGSLAGGAGGWAQSNPMEAGVLGLGALGSGLGIYDIMRANAAARERDFQAKKWLRTHPTEDYYSGIATPAAMTAFARPWLADTAASGVQSGGAWTQAIADAAAKFRGQYYPLAQQEQQSQFGQLFGPSGAYGQQPGALGSLGGVGQSLQTLLLLNALRNKQPQPTPGAADTNYYPSSYTPELAQYEGRQAPSMMPWGVRTEGVAEQPFYPDASMSAY